MELVKPFEYKSLNDGAALDAGVILTYFTVDEDGKKDVRFVEIEAGVDA